MYSKISNNLEFKNTDNNLNLIIYNDPYNNTTIYKVESKNNLYDFKKLKEVLITLNSSSTFETKQFTSLFDLM